MNGQPFVSHAQNREDVVLHRALKQVTQGRYVEVGANHPQDDSVSRAFYDQGWSGITVEPVHAFAELHRAQRERDILVEAAISDSPSPTLTLHQIAGTGLSSVVDTVGQTHRDTGWDVVDVEVPVRRLDDVLTEAGWQPGDDIHFLLVDVEGAERDVLATVDLQRWRPWVVVVEATEPTTTTPAFDSWEQLVTGAGYEFRLFDGLSRFYVSPDHRADIGPLLDYPACVHDDYVTAETVRLRRETEEAYHRANGANSGADALQREVDRLRAELDELRPQVADFAREREELTAQARRSDELRVAADAVAARWRHKAVDAWATSVAGGMSIDSGEVGPLRERVEHLTAELDATHRTLSWRITKPLRSVRSASLRKAAK